MGGVKKKQGNIQRNKETCDGTQAANLKPPGGCGWNVAAPDVGSLFHNWVLRERKKNGGGGGWLSEVPWLTVGLVVGHQSITTRVLVISRLVLLTPGLLVPELQKHEFGFL